MWSPSFSRRGSASLLASSALFALSSGAAAQPCTADGGCAKGFECKVLELPCAATAPACRPGQECAAPTPCESQTYTECVPASCEADADCGAAMVCHEQVSATCSGSGPACAPNTKCDLPPEPTACTTTTTKSCVAQWTLPCTDDASCGVGFTCVPDPDACACSAGVAGGRKDGDDGTIAPSRPNSGSGAAALPAPVAPDCSCTPSTTKHCQANAIACAADGDCPSMWTCVEANVGGTRCAAVVSTNLADGGVIAQPVPACDPPATPAPASKQCTPPYGSYGVAKGSTASAPSTSPGAAGAGDVALPRTPADATPAPASESASSDPSARDSAADSTGNEAAMGEGGGCQLGGVRAGAGGAGNALLLALIGVAHALRRRRKT